MLKIADSCIKCGACQECCPSLAIEVTKEKGPALVSDACIACGHCEAICPVGALEKTDLSHEQDIHLEQYPVLDGQTAELFLRSRRSVREWRQGIVSRAETEKLLQIGRYAQTGSNMQGIDYLVVESPEVMDQLLDLLVEWFRTNPDPVRRETYERFKAKPREFFRNAPQCMLALYDPEIPKTQRNGQFAFTYVELLAPSLGLGTCWAGYLESYLFTNDAASRKLLGIPDNRMVCGALLYGYPKYKYYKLVNRNPADILWR